MGRRGDPRRFAELFFQSDFARPAQAKRIQQRRPPFQCRARLSQTCQSGPAVRRMRVSALLAVPEENGGIGSAEVLLRLARVPVSSLRQFYCRAALPLLSRAATSPDLHLAVSPTFAE